MTVRDRPSWMWLDPDPAAQGVLLMDRIQYYIDRIGLIAVDDDSVGEKYADLHPQIDSAAYNLRVGNEFFQDGELKTLGEGEFISIPPNGLVYIRVLEIIRLPYYLIARPNLKVRQTYRGLLLGTGPQVNPGFEGYLSFPIHNFTDQVKAVRYGEELAQIDFVKTTPIPNGARARAQIEGNYLPRSGVAGIAGNPIKPWGGHKDPVTKDGSTRSRLPPGESVQSSLDTLNRNVNRYLSRQVIQFAVVFAGIALLLMVGTVFFDVQRHVVGALVPDEQSQARIELQLSELAEALDASESERARITEEIGTLRVQLDEISRRLETTDEKAAQ